MLDLVSAWAPSASPSMLKARAELNRLIRAFFYTRSVIEVETPTLSHASITDVHLGWLETHWQPEGAPQPHRLFLHTSPEFPMKRLLCAGSGDIYQLCKVFRDDAAGRFHNPEFTMLEWYRLGYDHHDLMNEMDELLQYTLQSDVAERKSYREIFQQYLAIDPLQTSLTELKNLSQSQANYAGPDLAIDEYLQLLFAVCIEPKLGHIRPCFIFDFPASQAALARLNSNDESVASRFEVYVKGTELANGFHELQSAQEQRQRFEKDNERRRGEDKCEGVIDERFICALESGLPDCAGVALGVDRLLMLRTGATHIQDVISFEYNRA